MLEKLKELRPMAVLFGIVLAIAVASASILQAGPLSSDEVQVRLNGIPTATQALTCTTSIATSNSALPSNSLVRIGNEGTTGINYTFGAAGTTLAVNGGPFLPGNQVEYVQNGAGVWFFCITRAGSSTPTLSIMR